MGRRHLKAAMPRLLSDHRSATARRLREVYLDLAERFDLADGTARRVAVMTARAFLDYTELSAELGALANGKGKARGREKGLALSRLRRRQQSAAGQFFGGLKTLEVLASREGRKPKSGAELLALHRQRIGS